MIELLWEMNLYICSEYSSSLYIQLYVHSSHLVMGGEVSPRVRAGLDLLAYHPEFSIRVAAFSAQHDLDGATISAESFSIVG
jgi:hypothetical protein